MNVNIRQDKLNSIMTKYLDSVADSENVINVGNYTTIYRLDDGEGFVHIMGYDNRTKELDIFPDFIFQFRSMFPIDRWDARDFIGEWFSKKFNLPVSDVL